MKKQFWLEQLIVMGKVKLVFKREHVVLAHASTFHFFFSTLRFLRFFFVSTRFSRTLVCLFCKVLFKELQGIARLCKELQGFVRDCKSLQELQVIT